MRRGFTLLELMVVVAIIAFLAMIAVPNVMRFYAKAKRAEAYMQLHSIYAAEKAYWMEHGKYTDALTGADSIGWKPDGYKGGGKNEPFLYTYGFMGGEGRNYVTGKLQTPASFLSFAKADKDGFVAVAAGDIDGDGKPDVLTINQDNDIQIVQDDIND
jgi:prepilin-type N-terminal cleavage/methylation domain-containing protein